jgi:acetyl esterase/lipase
MKLEERLHEEYRALFDMLPPLTLSCDMESVNATRVGLEQLTQMLNAQKSETVAISEKSFVYDEDKTVKVRIYKPEIKEEVLPAILWIHGGGYIAGSADMDDNLCERFVNEVKCIVVSVDYRLAPEYPYPAGLEDCYAALKWMVENHSALGIDPSRVGVAGVSAGGGLAAALALLTRDRKGPKLACQMPLYPMLDNENTTPSSNAITDERVWSKEKNIASWKLYLSEQAKGDIPYYASPGRASDLSGLPPTYTCIGDLDVFRDETISYISKLTQAGVATEFHLYPGCFHSCEMFFPQTKISQNIQNEYIQAAKNFLYQK